MKNMDDNTFSRWESQVRETAVRFTYPATPNLVDKKPQASVDSKLPIWFHYRLAWVGMILILMLAGLFMVPQVRAAVLRLLQAGAMTIFVTEPATIEELGEMQSTNTQAFTPYISELGDRVGLEMANASLKHPVQLPSELPMANQFYLDNMDKPTMLVSLWLDESGEAVVYSLYQIEVTNFASKGANMVSQTAVNGNEAFWIEGPHLIRLEDGRFQSWLFVEGNVLIWWEDDLTFRLEGAATIEEAVAIGESLQSFSTQQ
ncbi:MAG: hypothetical protein DWQ04_22265 [Chloroflexi bacterium]|nr:MAG: hypothetical protein DWQ04_22265 [Chloroflexota bacterium]